MAQKGLPDAMQDVELVVSGGDVLYANSGILAAASPVFAAMLSSDMVEGRTRKVRLEDKSKEAIESFLRIIHPVSGRLVKITADNIDGLVPLFEEYQVEGFTEECEAALLGFPASFDRLAFARRFGFDRAARRLVDELAEQFPNIPLPKDDGGPACGSSNDVLCDFVKKLAEVQQERSLQLKRKFEDLAHDVYRALDGVVNEGRAPYKHLRPGAHADQEIPNAIRELCKKL